MEKKQTLIYSLDEIDVAVELLKDLMSKCSVFTFSGPLGAGKTTLIRALLRSCDVTSTITSPTFTYMNIYQNKSGHKFYHFDLYRISSIEEFVSQGFNEYFYQPDTSVFIEWPEIIESLLSKQVCKVTIDYENDKRKLNYIFS